MRRVTAIRIREAVRFLAENGCLTPEQEVIDTMDAANYVGGAREIVDKMVEAAESTVGRKVE